MALEHQLERRPPKRLNPFSATLVNMAAQDPCLATRNETAQRCVPNGTDHAVGDLVDALEMAERRKIGDSFKQGLAGHEWEELPIHEITVRLHLPRFGLRRFGRD